MATNQVPQDIDAVFIPFSNTFIQAPQYKCCYSMILIPSLNYPLRCITCTARKDMKNTFFSVVDPVLRGHYVNFHTFICTICNNRFFQGPQAHLEVDKHIKDCVLAATYNKSRPFVCRTCFKVTWL